MAAIICFSLLLPDSPSAEPTTSRQLMNTAWRLTADQIEYDSQQETLLATGNVRLDQAGKKLYADQIRYHRSTRQAVATGHVRLAAEGDWLKGDRLSINLETETGTLYQGVIFIKENHFYIRGDRIEKTGPATYAIDDATLTSCDGDNPDWQIQGSHIKIPVGGYGSAWNAAMRLRQFPVLYVPYLRFPVRLERQSGFLKPQGGYSDRNGIDYLQPFYWAINDASDATLYYHHIQRRGEKMGIEYRYALSESAKGALMLDGFEDRHIDDGSSAATDKWGYADDNAIRPNDDRYWFRMKLNQNLPYRTTAKLDLDVVSDQDYLREFSDGYMGYDATDAYFVSAYGRDIDDENDPIRTNRLNLNRIWTYQVANADLVWYDNVIKRRQSDTNDTLQELPRLSFNALKQPLMGNLTRNPLFGSLDSEYNYFFREDGQTGHRLDLHPRFYAPIYVDRYFTFEPSAGFRLTNWHVDEDGHDEVSGEDRFKHRELYDLGAALSTDLNRVYTLDRERLKKIKHVVIPELSYEYIPGTNQEEYPEFDELDRIAGRNRMSLSFTHLLTSKSLLSDQREDAAPEFSYNLFCRFFIEQGYDFNRRDEPNQAWAPLYAELDLMPVHLLTLHADAEWGYDQNRFTSSNLSCRINTPRGDRLRLDYRYRRDFNQSLYVWLETPVTSYLTCYGAYERNLNTNRDIEKAVGTRFTSQCWAIDLIYRDKETDASFAVMVELSGLGQIGDGL